MLPGRLRLCRAALIVLLGVAGGLKAAPADLTTVDLSTLDTTRNYNLGPTGMRGWVLGDSHTVSGAITAGSWQILVVGVGAGTPAAGLMANHDVILGVSAGAGTPVTAWTYSATNDVRKSLGWAIGAAEASDGKLNLKGWRAGVTADVTLPLQILGAYSPTAPYHCPKSAIILSNACNRIANKSFNAGTSGDPVLGLALLASGNSNYLSKVRTYARSIAPANLALRFAPGQSTQGEGLWIWHYGYKGAFLAEYYLRTGDTSVLHGINEFAVALAQAQSRYGTFCHGGALLNADGSFHGTIGPYGPVNSGGLVGNLAIVLGKKAMVASGQAVDPEIDPAIDRAAKFFAFYVQKGNIPYGEHEPWYAHNGNGKESLAAVLFAMMGDKPVETEYWARLVTAGYNGREYGHTGQGFSYLWGAMAASVGGTNAATWTNSACVGAWTNVFSTNISFTARGLAPNSTCSFTFRATNALDTVWATNVQSFKTLAPVPPTPVLLGSAITVSNGVPNFTFGTTVDYKYRLVYKNTLTNDSWLPVIAPTNFPLPDGWSATSTGAPMSLSDTNTAGQPQRFYRLEAANP